VRESLSGTSLAVFQYMRNDSILAQAIAEIAIPLDRPRQQSMMMSSEFLALRRGLMSLIREESLKAMGGEVNDISMQGLDINLHGQSLADIL